MFVLYFIKEQKTSRRQILSLWNNIRSKPQDNPNIVILNDFTTTLSLIDKLSGKQTNKSLPK